MSATARKDEYLITLPTSPPVYPEDALIDEVGNADGTEYATRGARAHRASRPHLRMVTPLRPERASRGVFALVVVGMLIIGMVVILVINTSLAQGAFTVSELERQQADLIQQEQALGQAVAAAGAPDALEKAARAMGMVPSQTPVFVKVPSGKILGNPKPAPGGTASEPRLLTPADATRTEAVDNSAVGTDLPIAPGADYDPAAADAAQAQAAAANAAAAPLMLGGADAAATTDAAVGEQGTALTASGGAPVEAGAAAPRTEAKAAGGTAKPDKPGKKPAGENSLWSDSTVIDVSKPLASNDAGLTAVPVP